MKKKRLIFDIACFENQKEICGIYRVVYEILQRLLASDRFDIVLFSSHGSEEYALRNFRYNFPEAIPFQSRETEHFVLPEIPTRKRRSTVLGRLEDRVLVLTSDNTYVKNVLDGIRKLKHWIKPPTVAEESKVWREPRPDSPYLNRLIGESDIYFSPYYPPSQELLNNPDIKTAIILHDLIPLIFPESYSAASKAMLMELLTSFSQNMFLFANSMQTKNDFLRFCPLLKPEQITTVPLGVDERFFVCTHSQRKEEVRQKYKIGRDCHYILSLSSFDDRKNLAHVLKSFSLLLQRHEQQFPDIRLVLAGNRNWPSKKISQAFSCLQKSVQKKVVFTGYVEDDDLSALYSAASCFCFMSKYEGFGLPPLEAMQCGTPVIASNTSSLPEVVGNAGILLAPNDQDGLIDAFYQILTDEQLRNRMIEKGLVQAKKFNWDDCAAKIVERLGT